MNGLWQVPGLARAEVDGHLLVLEPASARLHVLNESARWVYELSDGRPEAAVVAAVAERSGADAAVVRDDVRRAARELREAGLLTDQPEPAPRRPTVRSAATTPPPATAGGRGDTTLVVTALGVTSRIDTPVRAVAETLAAVLTPLRTDDRVPTQRYELVPDPDGHRWSLHVDGAPLRAARPLARQLDHLLWHLNHTAVTAPVDGGDTRGLRLHAGAVAPADAAVLLAGAPEAGKSTLTAALAARGARYLTDEATTLHADLTVAPYPKPLSLERGAVDLIASAAPGWRATPAVVAGGKRHVAPASFPRVADRPHRIAAVVVLDAAPATPPLTARPLGALEATTALAGCCFDLVERGQDGLDTLAALTGSVPVWQLQRGPLADAVAVVHRLIRPARRDR